MTEKVKILYVDDEELNLEVFKIHFGNNYHVKVARNGLEGLEYLEEHKDIAVIISDMKMPKMNGLEFIQEAKKLYPLKKCFILTGFEVSDEIQSALKDELILEYFKKPFNIREIEHTVNKAISNKVNMSQC